MALRAKINPEKIPDRNQPLSIYKLSVTRGGEKVLREISFEVGQGEILGISGKTGSGKTTLASLIAGTLELPRKSIEYSHALHNGIDLLDLSIENRYRQGVHSIAQDERLFDELSVKDNLAVAMPVSSMKKVSSRIGDVAELFPALKELLTMKAGQCTPGQRQVVVIARAIMVFPSVLVIDEPTSGLDPTSINVVSEMLKLIISGSVGICLLDQRVDFLESVATRRLSLDSGTLVEPIEEYGRGSEWKPR